MQLLCPVPEPFTATNTRMSLYETKVALALEQLENENPAPLRTLAAELGQLPDDGVALILKRLMKEMNRLDSSTTTPLITGLLQLPLGSEKSEMFISVYTNFLGLLTSLNPKWWTDVAHKIVGELVNPRDSCRAHHALIARILNLVPTSVAKFEKIFTRHYPHKFDTTDATLNYLDNLLAVLEYAPDMQGPIWGLITERVMQLDVEVDDNEEDVDSDEEDSDEEEDDSEEEESDEDEDVEQPLKRQKLEPDSRLQELHEKLDNIVVFLTRYLDMKFQPNKIEENIPLFITLLDKFKEYVVPTHTTRCVQFLMFRVAHAHPDLMDAFLVSLIDMAVDPLLKIEKRQKAMQYVSSFVARAKGLSRDQVIKVVTYLAQWLSRYIAEREFEVDETKNMSRFRMFYVTCQALFYIFCFRHQQLHYLTSDTQWEAGLDKLFQRAIVTKFNPLKYCKSTVTYKFARIAQKHNVAYCFSIIEENRSGRFAPASSNRKLMNSDSVIWPNHREFSVLESYFPFDPLSLPKTRSLFESSYIQWNDVNENDGDSDSLSSASETEDEESDSDID